MILSPEKKKTIFFIMMHFIVPVFNDFFSYHTFNLKHLQLIDYKSYKVDWFF